MPASAVFLATRATLQNGQKFFREAKYLSPIIGRDLDSSRRRRHGGDMAPKKILTPTRARVLVWLLRFHATHQRVAIDTAAHARLRDAVSQVRRAETTTKGIARPSRSCILNLRTTFRCALRNKVTTRSSATRTAVVCPLPCRMPTTEGMHAYRVGVSCNDDKIDDTTYAQGSDRVPYRLSDQKRAEHSQGDGMTAAGTVPTIGAQRFARANFNVRSNVDRGISRPSVDQRFLYCRVFRAPAP